MYIIYHLLSYKEIDELFVGKGRGSALKALTTKNYFGFGRFQKGFLSVFKTIAEIYINNLPKILRKTPLNPYVIVEIRK